MASFVEFCGEHHISQPPDKIVKNLCTFLCQDVEQTPTFAYSRKLIEGINSFQVAMPGATKGKEVNGDAERSEPDKQADSRKARLARRGAAQAFQQLSTKFEAKMLEVIPNMWQSIAGGLLSACQGGKCGFKHYRPSHAAHINTETAQQCDALIEKQHGQDVIDSLSVLEEVIPTFHEELWPKLYSLFPMIDLALQSRFAIVRQCAARCFATICDLMTSEAMKYVIEKIVPLIADPLVLTNRQGATELIYRK